MEINFTKLNFTALNASRVNLTGGAAEKPVDWGYWPKGTPKAIREAAVCWYDIKRQGATNESLAEHPYLKDLTGNGHDMELRNFAFGGMSGIGGYNLDMSVFTFNGAVPGAKLSKTTTSFHLEISQAIDLFEVIMGMSSWDATTAKSFRIKSTYTSGFNFIWFDPKGIGVIIIEIPSNGEVTITPKPAASNSSAVYFSFENLTTEGTIDVELLPVYPGALVSDGVDDYGYVEGLPLLTKDRGFTVMAVRKWLRKKSSTALASKAIDTSAWGGAFVFEIVLGGGISYQSNVFNSSNPVTDFASSDFSFLTTRKYNDKNITAVGYVEDNGYLVLFRSSINVDHFYGKFALYRFILFDRDLTDDEIGWVRVNIMKAYTVAELCAMGYGVETSYGYNLTGNFTEAGVPVPSDLAARLAGEDGKLLKVTNLKADAAFWEAVRAALKEVTITAGNPLPNYWNGTDIGGDVEMTVAGGDYQTTTNMRGQGIRKLTLNLPSGFINSLNNAFVWAVTMEELVINGTVTTNDWTACFDHCTALKTFTAPEWGSGGSNAAYGMPVSQMNSAFQQCPALNTIPQYGTEREAAGNTLRPASMQNMLSGSGVEVLGPVVDCRYINPASASQCAGAFGTKLTDARLANLNHGDWWLDGSTGDHVTHGAFNNFTAASIKYLVEHLWDLTTDKVGKNWKTVENSFSLWTVDSPAARDGATAVTIPARSRSGAQAAYVWTGAAVQSFKVRVTGLQPGDKLCIGAVGSTPGDDAITEDGVYTRSWSGAGYVVNFNDEATQPTGAVRLEIAEQPYDPDNHMVSSAALHVPEAWREKLTDAMLNAAAAKGWSVWIGDEELKAGGLDASLVDAWVFSGYRNEDAPESVQGENGNALELRNFAYTAESGFADGWLVTDGDDDFCINENLPVLDDYTVIMRRKVTGMMLSSSVASKHVNASTPGEFMFELRNSSGVYMSTSFSGALTGTEITMPEEYSWQTKTSYNGVPLTPGTDVGGKIFTLFTRGGNTKFTAAEIAWCALYDRSLTEDEINAEVAKLDALWESRKV